MEHGPGVIIKRMGGLSSPMGLVMDAPQGWGGKTTTTKF
jgi:hypothetical protein